jgi:hypothetical protein
MKELRTIKSALLFFLFVAGFGLKAQTLTTEMLNGPDAYFKTYDDFLKGNAIPFDKVLYKFTYKNTPFSITFTTGKQKTTLGLGEIWGYRYKNILNRIIPGPYNSIPVIAIGDMILYGDIYYPTYMETGKDIFYYYREGKSFFSKDLGSTVGKAEELKKDYPGTYDKFFNCTDNIHECYFNNMTITFVSARVGKKDEFRYEKIEHKKISAVVNGH